MSWASWDEGGGGTATATKSSLPRQRNILSPPDYSGLSFGQPEGAAASSDPFAGATVSNVTQNVHSPPGAGGGAFSGRPDWWNVPGLRFNSSGQVFDPAVGVYRTVQAPAWMGNPQEFYGPYQEAVAAGYGDTYISNAMSAHETQQQNLAQLSAGRNWLTGQQHAVDTAANSWAHDPGRLEAMAGMMENAAPGHQFFTPEQRSAATVPIGQQYALSDIYQRGSAAGHGTAEGGGAGQSNQALAIQAATGGQQIRAEINAREQALKQQALGQLAGTTATFNAADTAYVNAGNQLSGALAALESGVQFNPTDYSVWPALNQAQQRADQEAADKKRAMDEMIKEAQFGPQDLASILLSLAGTGIPKMLF